MKTKLRKIRMMSEVRTEKYRANGDEAAWAAEEKLARERRYTAEILRANPAIGKVVRDGKDWFYRLDPRSDKMIESANAIDLTDDVVYPKSTVSLNYGLLDSYLNTEEKRREHLRGIRLDSMFHQITLTVRGVEHVYENRIGGWFKLNAKTRAEIASYTGGAK